MTSTRDSHEQTSKLRLAYAVWIFRKVTHTATPSSEPHSEWRSLLMDQLSRVAVVFTYTGLLNLLARLTQSRFHCSSHFWRCEFDILLIALWESLLYINHVQAFFSPVNPKEQKRDPLCTGQGQKAWIQQKLLHIQLAEGALFEATQFAMLV